MSNYKNQAMKDSFNYAMKNATTKDRLIELDKKAKEYVEKFWYEKPANVKAIAHMAFKAGYTTKENNL